MEYVVREAHEIPDRAPLQIAPGEVVSVGDRDTTWPAFVFVTAARGAGWVPARHLSADSGPAMVHTPYDTTELPVGAGDTVTVLSRDDESGWWWCRDQSGREGWVPLRNLEE
ncbi:MAG: SH3 domain-containing protein [Acidimicrobiia bacterium]|nr:SH3 domain-containing protein [Acidimicrobiia bacterium]